MQANELAERMKSKKSPPVIDVRSGGEFGSGHIPGAIHAPTWKILVNKANLPEDKHAEMVVTCELGPRALMAQKLLNIYGYRKVTLLEGHMAEWRRAGRPLEK